MRRANGTGSVTKLSGNRRRPYAVKVSFRDQYGVIRQRVLSYHAKAAEAQAALDEYIKNSLSFYLFYLLLICFMTQLYRVN